MNTNPAPTVHLNWMPNGNLISPHHVEELYKTPGDSWVIRMTSGKEHQLAPGITFDQVVKILAGQAAFDNQGVPT